MRRLQGVTKRHDPTRGDKLIIAGREVFTIGEWMYFGFQVGGSHKPPRKWFSSYARLPIDRFVEWHAEGDGMLQLPPVRLDPTVKAMTVNARTADDGWVRVRILRPRGQSAGAETLAHSEPMTGDSLHHSVKFTNANALAAISRSGNPAIIVFDLHKAGLFAFGLE